MGSKRKATLISQASNLNRDYEQALTLALAVRLIVLRSSLSLHCSSSSTWVEFIHYESFPIQDLLPIPLKLLPLPKPACFFWLPVGGLKPEKEDPVGYTISIQSEIHYQLSYQGVFSRITSLLFQYSYAPASAANS